MPKSALIIFLDGVGLGPADSDSNPFMHVELPTFQKWLSVPHLTQETAGTVTPEAALLGLDANLGIDGLPQSGTGQTTILTGRNAPAVLGKHYGPYPNQPLREMIKQDNLFKVVLEAGYPAAYANAYPAGFLDRLKRGKGRLSANTQAAHLSGVRLRSGEDLRQGRAISALMRNDFWPESDFPLPSLNAYQAGQQLATLAHDHTLTFFEFWYSDMLGHKQMRAESLEILGQLDQFVAGALASLDLSNTIFMIISDHGNFEDWTTSKHTYNPALTFLAGVGFDVMLPNLHSLADIKPTLLEALGVT
ncbi:MAG: hypothetical protein AAF629_16585 [Chloroflexota bacterium]